MKRNPFLILDRKTAKKFAAMDKEMLREVLIDCGISSTYDEVAADYPQKNTIELLDITLAQYKFGDELLKHVKRSLYLRTHPSK
jgi:hypothetical protein